MCCLVNWDRTRYACLYISTDCNNNKKNNTPLLTWCLLAEMAARFFDFQRIHSSGENVQRENAVIQPYHKLTNEVCNGEGGGCLFRPETVQQEEHICGGLYTTR
ncbi:Uncharacterized protein APZ42_015297 [Daphnia magna]|uniref:Uncharacterized protein n=1 Tax=Daphnia magna TaxID=35525 RepID=A0A0P5FF98_9CRUS|nr:Uncharacterized protein APZ42_015297 [Daphnia magna]